MNIETLAKELCVTDDCVEVVKGVLTNVIKIKNERTALYRATKICCIESLASTINDLKDGKILVFEFLLKASAYEIFSYEMMYIEAFCDDSPSNEEVHAITWFWNHGIYTMRDFIERFYNEDKEYVSFNLPTEVETLGVKLAGIIVTIGALSNRYLAELDSKSE